MAPLRTVAPLLLALISFACVGCLPSPGPFRLEAARGRIVDLDTGEAIVDAEIFQTYRGAGPTPGRQPEYHTRWTRSDADGHFAFPGAAAPSPRMWLLETYGPSYGFYHPSYGLERSGAAPAGEPELSLGGSLRRSAERLRDLAPFCRRARPGETARFPEREVRDAPPEGAFARHLAAVACPAELRARYPDGSPRASGATDARGRRDGPWTFYRNDGSVIARGHYRAGGATGRWQFYGRDGQPLGP